MGLAEGEYQGAWTNLITSTFDDMRQNKLRHLLYCYVLSVVAATTMSSSFDHTRGRVPDMIASNGHVLFGNCLRNPKRRQIARKMLQPTLIPTVRGFITFTGGVCLFDKRKNLVSSPWHSTRWFSWLATMPWSCNKFGIVGRKAITGPFK